MPRLSLRSFVIATTALLSIAPAGGLSARSVSPAVPPGIAADQPKCWFGACFQYVAGTQYATNTGASVTTDVEQPKVDAADVNAHSLQELAVMTTDRAFIVEIGWTVDQGLNGDTAPHLFVYHWVNNGETCYNGCGFVSTSSTRPGIRLVPNTSARLAIRYFSGNWWLSYNGGWIGYFPGSLWNNAYTQASEVEAFGEVSSTTTPTCTDMGNGRSGSDPASSWFSGFQLFGSTASPNWTVTQTSPSQYTYGNATGTSFHLGGPGSGTCAAPTPR
ncbi:hypothetical protein GCM10029978_063290 [Actinoallomurus acanthiterrae]